ncbi:MAG TPA: DUF1499 domain-containing protein [Rhizomicrobium sp.]|nr:DUF1499 domain-containing protein [Rhizomicrobium sp.]
MRFLGVVARLSCAAFAASLLLGLTAAFGTRLEFWNYHVGLYGIFPWCLYCGVAGAALGLAWAAVAFFANSGEGARYGAIGLVGSLAVIASPLYTYAMGAELPPIHDISTDTEHAPEFVALMGQRPGAENSPIYHGDELVEFKGKLSPVSALQHKYYEDVHATAILTSPESLFRRATRAAYAMGWNIVAVAPDEGRLEATDTSFFFGFTDDIVIRVKPAGLGARLDIRSESRVDTRDWGRNADRIRAYMKQLAKS